MVHCVRWLLVCVLLLGICGQSRAADARFDLVGPRLDVRVTRGTDTLPIALVPNLQPGDKLWLHPDLPPTQSVKYLLICVFLRGTTNPPPDDWFIRINTWDKNVREEGAFVTVPVEAQQVVLFMAPETGGDFSTLRSAVKGRPGIFVRAQQDLVEAGFEQARIEKYMASIRRVPPSDPADLQKHSDLLARTLALKPNEECFKRPVDTQFTCLTQTGTQSLLDDGHGQSIVSSLSNGPNSDFINAASYTSLAGAGLYSAYVGAIVDLVRIMGNLHTAQYQYIPAIAFPQGQSLNLRLNTPPSFHNPKSVLVIGLPSVQAAKPPPLRPADAAHVTCLLRPSVTLPIEGAPLVFSTAFAHDLVLHLNTPPGAPDQSDIPLFPDAFQGGLVLQRDSGGRKLLHDPTPLPLTESAAAAPGATPIAEKNPKDPQDKTAPKPEPEPVMLTGTIKGRWGFDPFTGPTVQLQQLPGEEWHIVSATGEDASPELIAGHTAELFLTSTGASCVHGITAQPNGAAAKLSLAFKSAPKPEQPNLLAVTLPLDHNVSPGDLHLAIQQFGQPRADELSTRTFSEPAHITAIELRAHDKFLDLNGTQLAQIDKVTVGDLVFRPAPAATDDVKHVDTTARFTLGDNAPTPPTKRDDHLTAQVTLHDGRTVSVPIVVSAPRPVISLLRKSTDPIADNPIAMTNADDVPLAAHLTFTLKSPSAFPRNGRIEIATLDGTLRTVLTLAPSGGLLLQDPHTVVATLDPLRSFGPSAFGPIHLRAVYPLAPDRRASNSEAKAETKSDSTAANPTAVPAEDPESTMTDWLPLATLVRLPTLTRLQCPTDATLPCTLTGSSLFLIDSLSIDPAFANPVPVPDGYTGSTLTLPHPAASTIFLHLRDDPTVTDSAVLPAALPPATTAPAHTRVAHN
ncbi:MAG TPA: hypothetical protein VGN16_01030 [Acidobacteriaceae bacterium]|jgi:hypothetical protein